MKHPHFTTSRKQYVEAAISHARTVGMPLEEARERARSCASRYRREARVHFQLAAENINNPAGLLRLMGFRLLMQAVRVSAVAIACDRILSVAAEPTEA